MIFLAQLYYINYQPETFLVRAESETAAIVAMKKLAPKRGGALDKNWPGTMGQGVAVASYAPSAKELQTIQMVNVTVSRTI